MEKTIRIKYHTDKIDKLQYIDGKSDWIDLRAAEDYTLKKGDFKLINLGVSVEIPKGYEMLIASRSSTFKNFGLIQTNAVGIVDESYCADSDVLMWPCLATRDTQIHVNDRLCQFRILEHQPQIIFEEVESLGNAARGGFGSTGIK
ncbi:MAG: deoxyuridine 5'-triphosphate nucleotidohydrolase [Lachnospiraceae bacterium]|nr:deoxyuridine 5'-triphosphate nucleotidohydrolase [Lachnospiraceae bacterium]